jgi:putative ABC transport system substrate-binding protein
MMTLAAMVKMFPFLRKSGLGEVLRCLALLFFLQNTNLASAQSISGIVVINSDAAVKHYALAQAAFTEHLSDIKANITLADQTADVLKEQILRINPRFIYTIGSKAYLLAQEMAEDRTIVFSSVLNWQRLPVSKNVYGVSNELPSGMQLMTYRYLFPEMKKIGVLYSERFNKEWLDDALINANDVGIEIVAVPITATSELMPALQKLLPQIDAFWLISDPVVLADRQSVLTIFNLGADHKKPVIAYSDIFANLGATLSLSADIATMGMQAASMVNELQQEKTIPQRIVDPAGSHIILNMRKVKEYGLQLNYEALGSVNQIIE